MMHAWRDTWILALALALLSARAEAQTTYRLHRDASSTPGNFQLRTDPVTSPTTTFQSIDLKNLGPTAVVVVSFDTAAGVPNASGVIPLGTTVNFRVWMKKTANWGELYPQASLYLNNNQNGQFLCTATGSTQISSSTVGMSLLSCTTNQAVTVTPMDRWFVAAGADLRTTPGNHTVKVELYIEGVPDGQYDSTVTAPAVVANAPAVQSVFPTNGTIGTSVTITGTNFGSTKGSSSVKFFNNVTATVASGDWTATSIRTTVPSGAATGPVTVTTTGGTSNSVAFTVLGTGGIAGTVSRATGGTPVSGALAEALQSGMVRASATTAGNGMYSLTSLPAGTYDLRTTAAGFVTEVNTGIVIAGGATTTANVSLTSPGSIGGRITQADGVTPIAGAAVTASQGLSSTGSTVANAMGDYVLSGLRPGTYGVIASAIGYSPTTLNGIAVSENNSTTANASLQVLDSSEVRYTYDEVGRLVGVTLVDGAGVSAGAATYSYDAVGNLTRIDRIAPASVAITEFSPNSGAVGATVTIYGTGFSATPGSNQVAFNGQPAAVSTATTTQLVVAVPSQATTGAITVTSPSGSATSAPTQFTIVTAGGPPAVSGFTPSVGNAGTAVTITGANFDPNPAGDRLAFNIQYAPVSSATASSLSANVAAAATSGKISVSTAAGRGVSANDFFVAPAPYTAVDVVATARFGFDQSQVITIGTANKIALAVFDATVGQRVSIAFTESSLSVTATLYDPYGAVVGTTPVDGYGGIFEPFVIPFTGTYTVLLVDTFTGSVRLSLNEMPADKTGTITIGGSATMQIDVPGQNGTLTFSGAEGQRISLLMSEISINVSNVSILNPDGSQLAAYNALGTSGGFIDTATLPASGTYTIVLDPLRADIGSIRFDLYQVPADFSGTIAIGGSAVTVPIDVAGQNGRLTFTGAANQRISLTVTNVVSIGNATISILKPDGSTLVFTTAGLGGGFIDATTLPVSGTYTVLVDPLGANTGSLSVTLYSVSDYTGTITPGGAAVTVPLTTPGQNGRLTFTGSGGQRISLLIGAGPLGSVTIQKPDGTTLASGSITAIATFIDRQTLPTNGTYTIVVDPTGAETGNVTLTLYNVPADSTGTLTVNGNPVSVSIGTPGQNATRTFSGLNGQHVTVHVTNNTMNVTVKLQKADGTVLASSSSVLGSFDLPSVTLPAKGTYTIVIDPSLASTGSLSVRVTNP